jgi:ATP-dependent helicase HepA
VPYLLGTAQETLFFWLQDGLGAFQSTCSFGHQIFSEFESTLDSVMQGDEDLKPLIAATRERREQLAIETEQGRDRLLERHSHNSEIGNQIIRSLGNAGVSHCAARFHRTSLRPIRDRSRVSGGESVSHQAH